MKSSIDKIKQENYENYFIYAYNKDYYKNKQVGKKYTRRRTLKVYKNEYKSAFKIRVALKHILECFTPYIPMPIFTFDTRGGLCNQFYDIKCGIKFLFTS